MSTNRQVELANRRPVRALSSGARKPGFVSPCGHGTGSRGKSPHGDNSHYTIYGGENIAHTLANRYEQGPSVGNLPPYFRADIVVELRFEMSGIERTIKEDCKVQVELLNRQITRVR